ncbi:unnamed protein product [Adineta ricciae]|uniref:HTH CENPB-type domain-containing protein n=1 Tax=Adineta ricciae TaxID=249248 RepID=A0A815SM49_ADIRI|nr:unnamed protein product [Adineta ricciae]
MHEQARQIRQQLGGSNADDFKTSNGWLENFRKRHGIKYRTINGESATVDEYKNNAWETVTQSTIDNTFRMAGFINRNSQDIIATTIDNENDVDEPVVYW